MCVCVWVNSCDFIVHYGHSCLIPTSHINNSHNNSNSNVMSMNQDGSQDGESGNIGIMYVFVEISFDYQVRLTGVDIGEGFGTPRWGICVCGT